MAVVTWRLRFCPERLATLTAVHPKSRNLLVKVGLVNFSRELFDRGAKMKLRNKMNGFYYSSVVYIYKTAAIDLLLSATA